MSWKEIYKPTVGNIIIPAISFLLAIYRVIFGMKSWCEVDCGFYIKTVLIELFFALVIIILLVYPIICWLFAFFSWIFRMIKKK